MSFWLFKDKNHRFSPKHFHISFRKGHEQDLLFAGSEFFKRSNIVSFFGKDSHCVGVVVWVVCGEVNFKVMRETLDCVGDSVCECIREFTIFWYPLENGLYLLERFL